jgi:hypothetical protein
VVFFDQNTLAGDWRAQVRYCRENGIALYRDIAFALAVADMLELPDDLPLMPAVIAAVSIPACLNDQASLAHLKAAARAAARDTSEHQTDGHGENNYGTTLPPLSALCTVNFLAATEARPMAKYD